MRFLTGLVLVLVMVGCNGSKSTGDVPDAIEEVAQVEVAADLFEEVGEVDAIELTEVAADVIDTPDPSLVTEELVHPNCVPGGPYLVDRSEQVRTVQELPVLDVTAVLALNAKVYAGTTGGLFVRSEPGKPFELVSLPYEDCRVTSLAAHGDAPVVGCTVNDCDFAVFSLALDGPEGFAPCDGEPVGPARVLSCEGHLFSLFDQTLHCVSLSDVPSAADVWDATCGDGALWASSSMGLKRTAGGVTSGAWEPVCGPESCGDLRLLSGAGDAMWAAGNVRVAKLVESSLDAEWLAQLNGLPYDHFTAIAPSPDAKTLAIGHDIGVTLLHPTSGEIEHLHSGRYLPAQEVRDLSWDDDGGLWVATPGGLARLYKEEIFLQDKAELLLDKMEQWFFRLDGFLTAGANFDDPWNDQTATLWDDDNDGQWTEEGVGALCYAYQVTGDERYYEAARRCVENMMMLIDIPAVSFEEAGMARGFISRSVVRDDEGPVFASKATQDNWHLVHWTDGHDYYWKDDTSSDEWTGHFFGLPLYYDFCAKDDAERAEIAEHVAAAAGYLLDNDYLVIDLDGEPTTHGDYRPERLTMALDGLDGCMDAGHDLVDCVDAWGGGAFLDSVELLSFMAGAWHVTGELRFLEALDYLTEEAQVDEAAMFHENVATWTGRGTTNYCDHELADLAFLTLIRYDPSPERRQQWLGSMLAAWEWEIGERNPLKALSMAAFIGDSEGLEAGVQSLVEYPDDLRMWRVDNSHRVDVEPDVNDRHGDPQFKTALPYDELPILRWDHNPYGVAGGGDGSRRMSPAFWLLPYWGLRYHNAICPTDTE